MMRETLLSLLSLFTLASVIPIIASRQKFRPLPGQDEANRIRQKTISLLVENRYVSLIQYLDEIEKTYGTLGIDKNIPSLFSYKGVALSSSAFQNQTASVIAFMEGVAHLPHDTRSWINLGELYCQTFNLTGAVWAFGVALSLGDVLAYSRLLRAKGWGNMWQDMEVIESAVAKDAHQCPMTYLTGGCRTDSASGLEYAYVRGDVMRFFHLLSPNSKKSPKRTPINEIAPFWNINDFVGTRNLGRVEIKRRRKKLKVGLLSSDFGVHPVATLLRGAVQFMDDERIELFAFAITPKVSWWGANISSTLGDHFVWLQNLNDPEAAAEIANRGVEILIDLNGHTINTGLSLMAHQPAPIQMTFLGLPTSSGADFIDYYLGDPVALPAEHADHFSEKIALLPPTYIVNDYAQMRGSLVKMVRSLRESRESLGVGTQLNDATFVMASLSNCQKFDPPIFMVWSNLLVGLPGSKLFLVSYLGSDTAVPNLKSYGAALGVAESRIIAAEQIPWSSHLQTKTSIDIALDTPNKNGHTTGLDSIWAGLPTLTVGGGGTMPQRAGESIATALNSDVGLVYSLKCYEDTVFRIRRGALRSSKRKFQRVDARMKKQRAEIDGEDLHSMQGEEVDIDDGAPITRTADVGRLAVWRRHIERQRTLSPAFDTRLWTSDFMSLMEAIWEGAHVTTSKSKLRARGEPNWKLHNVFASGRKPEDLVRDFPIYQVYDEGNGVTPKGFSELILAAKKTPPDRSTVKSYANLAPPEKRFTINENGFLNLEQNRELSPSPNHVDIDDEDEEQLPLPAGLLENNKLIMLNIGGTQRRDGWLNVNIVSEKKHMHIHDDISIDIIRRMDDLHGFPNDSVSVIYSSHSLEHNGYSGVHNTLVEWHRVLRPGGVAMISIPNLRALSHLYLSKNLTTEERWVVTWMIFGGQSDKYDFHKVGLDIDFLTLFLKQAGFCKIERVKNFNLFEDTSTIIRFGVHISLNVKATVCTAKPYATRPWGGFTINAEETPWDDNEYDFF